MMGHPLAPVLKPGMTLMFGVVGDHDEDESLDVLEALQAWIMAWREMPLLPASIRSDCLVAPPERGGVHVEIRWVVV